MKEIDQRFPQNRILINCNCGHYHFLEFSFSTDIEEFGEISEKTKKDIWKYYSISLIDEKIDFLSRLKDCFKYLFSFQTSLCYREIGITSKDMKKITEHFKKYQAL